MTEYLYINIFIILIPLIFSFEQNIKFYKKIIPVFISIFTVGVIFITWDIIAVIRGDWSFNEKYISNLQFINVPVEEILFFITVPYSILFIYECIRFYSEEKLLSVNIMTPVALIIISFTFGVIYFDKNYTSAVLIFSGIVIIISLIFTKTLLFSKTYLLTILISVIPFFIVNYILTSLPVVIYNNNSILGIRIFTIPVEDFFYSFSMITCWIIVYQLIKKNKTVLKIRT